VRVSRPALIARELFNSFELDANDNELRDLLYSLFTPWSNRSN